MRKFFDRRTLEDPVALKTCWDPLVIGGWNFCTHRLLSSQGRAQMQVAPIAHLFCFFCIGLGIVISGYTVNVLNDPDPSVVTSGNIPIWLVPYLPLTFSVFGSGLLWWLYRKNVLFDKKKGIYVRQGRRFSLNEVHAVQLIKEYCANNNSTYFSYELNLVLKTGERCNVTDHASLRAIRADGIRLAEYLGVPNWDAIDYEI